MRALQGDYPRKRRRWFAKSTLILLLLVAPWPLSAADPHPFGQGLLWRVEKPGGQPSHVFGTMHSAEREVVALPPPVAQALERADSLALEIVMTGEVRSALGQAMLLFDGRTLRDIAGPGLTRRVAATGARYGMAPEQVQLLKPWALMLLFSIPPSEFLRQSAGRVPLDQMLQQQAQSRRIPLYSLESVDEQVAALAALPEADQLQLLDDTIALNPTIEELFDTMRRTYLAGDLAGLHRLKDELTKDTEPRVREAYDERLIHRRNRRMVERMAPRLAEGQAFVAVGALHLSGRTGILTLLSDQGYTVTRVH